RDYNLWKEEVLLLAEQQIITWPLYSKATNQQQLIFFLHFHFFFLFFEITRCFIWLLDRNPFSNCFTTMPYNAETRHFSLKILLNL
ncbi:MAG: hypothetical protein WCF06_15795, partial [Nitrososphaeraceae archaeon]